MMMGIIEIIIAALAAFFLGSLWYSKLLFGKTWSIADKRNPDDMGKSPHKARIFIVAGILYLVSAAFTYFLIGPDLSVSFSTGVGFMAGLGIAAASFGINYAFAGRSFKLWLIDAGYHTLQFTLYGLVFGLFS